MSYSFSARGKDVEAMLTKVGSEFATIVANQPIHAKDREAVIAAVRELAEIVEVEDGKELIASVSGSVYWQGTDTVRSASVNISVSQDTPAAP